MTSGNDLQKQKQFAKLDAKKNDRVVKVVRGGEQTQIPIFDIAAGDIVLLETGDIVCADGIFIEGHGMYYVAAMCDCVVFTNYHFM